jgi:broad specificity phosphatase PhoE
MNFMSQTLDSASVADLPDQNLIIKKIFFVRHGPTDGNSKEQPFYQHFDTPLSTSPQASALMFKRVSVLEQLLNTHNPEWTAKGNTAFVSSTMLRGLQTADFVCRQIPKMPQQYLRVKLLREIMRPIAVRGRSKYDFDVVAIMKKVAATFYMIPEEARYRPDGMTSFDSCEDMIHHCGENFLDLVTRSKDCLQFLVGMPEKTVVAVTHGYFLRILLGIMMFGETYNSSHHQSFEAVMKTDNCGVSVIEVRKSPEGVISYAVRLWNGC